MNSIGQARVDARRENAREELGERLSTAIPADGASEPIPGLKLFRASQPSDVVHTMYTPAFCVLAGGAKEVMLGNERFVYDQDHFLISAMDLPVASRVIEASPSAPYLSMRLSLDPTLVSSVMIEAGTAPGISGMSAKAVHVSALDADLLETVVRLSRLLERPREVAYLFPMVTREIVFRLLKGDQGPRLAHIATHGGTPNQITSAIQRIRNEFDQPMRTGDIARDVGMSVSGFHHHFKSVTGMSPLQFQKQLRLQEARRLLVGTDMDAAHAAFTVGYDNASHFSREDKRLFGAAPRQDAERLRNHFSEVGE